MKSLLRLLLCLAPLAAAEQQKAITGYVTDPSGAFVGGARAVLSCDDRRAESTTTSPEGFFQFEVPETGPCELRVAHRNFQPAALTVTPGEEALLVQLGLAELRQEITVSGEAQGVSVETAANVDTIEVDTEFMATLPMMDQDVIATMAGFLDAGAVGTAGYGLVVDGMETDELGVSNAAIQEVRINRNPYSAEFYSPGRGRIEVTTRKSDPAFHGNFNVSFRDYRLYARNAFAEERAPERRVVYEGFVSGPLTRNGRTLFMAGGEFEKDDEWSLIYARTPSGLVNQQFPQPEREKEFFGRVTRFFSETNSLSLRYEYEIETEDGSGAGGFDLADMAYDEHDQDHDALVTHQATVGASFLNELRARLRWDDEGETSRVTGQRTIVVEDAFTTGGAQVNEVSRDYRFEFQDVVSWSKGPHAVKAGVNVNDLSRRFTNDLSGRDGTFYFSSMEDYLAGQPFSFEQQTGDGRALFWTGQVAGFVQDDMRLRSNLTLGLGLRYQWQTYPSGLGALAPRVSMAWAPGGARKWVLRGGAGMFYDRMWSSAPRDTMLYDGQHLRRVVLTNPGYPDPFSTGAPIEEQPVNIVRFHPDLGNPRLLNYSGGVERQLGGNTTLSVMYRGVYGWRLFRSLDRNAPRPPDFVRPNPEIAFLREIQSDARMTTHALEATLRGNLSRFFSGAVLYTLGRTWNDTNGISWMPPNSLDLSGEWSRAGYDRRHRFRTYGTLRVPRLFDIGLIFSATSGTPYSLTTGLDENRDGRATDRPPGIPRHSLEGPGEWTVDVRWSREFDLPVSGREDKTSVRLAVDAFNVLNHVNPTDVVGNMSSPFFGQPTRARSPRRIQLSLRFRF